MIEELNDAPDPEFVDELSQELLQQDFEELSPNRQKVIESIAEGEAISRNSNRIYHETSTIGERLSDKLTAIGGSWPFLIGAILILALWILVNSQWLFFKDSAPFDPYPYILLNLGLSMLAAFQAPIIMMSQNRQIQKDRIDASSNYDVCLKMELDITRLHNRLDELEILITRLSRRQ